MTEHSNDEWVLVPKEPTDEMLRASCAVDYPALYREFLRHPVNGKRAAKDTELDISKASKRYSAMLAAAPTPPSTDRIAALEAVEAIIAKHLDGAIRAAGRGHDTIPVNIIARDISEMRDEIRAILAAEQRGAASSQQAEPVKVVAGSDDLVLVPRSLLASASHAIKRKADAPKTLDRLKTVMYGPAAASPSTASDSTRVTVKPLEWERPWPDENIYRANADPMEFSYQASKSGRREKPYHVTRSREFHPFAFERTLDEAKAAAQKDYERRVLSALQFTDQKGDA